MKTKLLSLLSIWCISLLLTAAGCNKDNDPVAGIPGTQGIYLHLEYRYGLGVEIYYRPYLLFKDGTIYQNLDVNPDKLNIEQSKKDEPKNWGTWKKQGEDIVVQWPDETDTWEKDTWYTTLAATKGEQISGTYRSLSGISNIQLGGSSTVIATATLSFSGNKFTYETFGGSTDSQTVAYGSKNKAGTYTLNGNTIELRFNDGSVEKKFFYFYPGEGAKTVFGVGSNYYILRK
jgi:hypothetical protein